MLIEGIMAIQKVIDNDHLPRDKDGKRLPLQLAMSPNYEPGAQPIDVTIGAT
jgi:hypothetical protein